MAATNSNINPVEQKGLQGGSKETAKNWLTRRLRRPASRERNNSEERGEIKRHVSLRRPQTAPSGPVGRQPVSPVTWEPLLTRPRNEPPPRPQRPNSGVIRDVNEWLDASMIKPAPALMAGLPYWREGPFNGSRASTDVRYAMPIPRDPETQRPGTSHSQHIKSFYRRAKRMQVRMPTLLTTKSQRTTVVRQNKVKRRSASMPHLSLLNEVHTRPAPNYIIRSRSLTNMTPRLNVITASRLNLNGHNDGWLGLGYRQTLEHPRRLGRPITVRFGDQGSYMKERTNTASGVSTRFADTTWTLTAGNCITREDSIGNLSDAPTYSSGPPPPSYRSRAASIVTTSSFGCIDGMSHDQRQLRQHRAAQHSRGIRGRIKKLAQKAHFRK